MINLLANGAAPKEVQELLGHVDVSTTMNIYAHATREAKRSSVRLLDKVVGGRKEFPLFCPAREKTRETFYQLPPNVHDLKAEI